MQDTSLSYITREKLIELGAHYKQYIVTEMIKKSGGTPEHEFGEPHFKSYKDRISIPLTINGKGTGSARFIDDRTLKIYKIGIVKLSRAPPVLFYRPVKATIYQTADKKWRLSVNYDVEIPRPKITPENIKTVGIDRNVGNIATHDTLFITSPKVVDRMERLERSSKKAQRDMARRQGPDKKKNKKISPSKRYEKARIRHARRERNIKNIRRNVAYEIAVVLVTLGYTHAIVENLKIKNMTKSAKGTMEKPGRNVSQKSGLNKVILKSNWGLLVSILDYVLSGGVIKISPAYTSMTCSLCYFVDKKSRSGRSFYCTECGFKCHADTNAGRNIKRIGEEVLCEKCKEYKKYKMAHGKGCLDVEDHGGVNHSIGDDVRPMNRQTRTETRDNMHFKHAVVVVPRSDA